MYCIVLIAYDYLQNGPTYPKLLRVEVINSKFLYREHSVLLDFCDPRVQDVEVLMWDDGMPKISGYHWYQTAHKWYWKKVIIDDNDNGDYRPIDRDRKQLLIYRIADHPGGTNAHCIGLQELADTCSYLLRPNGNLPRLYPDEAPPDLESYLVLPSRCICGRVYFPWSLKPDILETPGAESICPENKGCKQVKLRRWEMEVLRQSLRQPVKARKKKRGEPYLKYQ